MFILDTFLSQRPIKQFHLTVSGPKRESILKGPCDCFHMVGQHGDKHDELRPRSIWLVPQYCPSTAVILHPNIWVIARYAWELSAPPILGIPHWQHASNSSAAPPSTHPSLHSHFSHTRPPRLKHYHTAEFYSGTCHSPSLRWQHGGWGDGVPKRGGGERSCKSRVFVTSRIGVKCNEILYVCQK